MLKNIKLLVLFIAWIILGLIGTGKLFSDYSFSNHAGKIQDKIKSVTQTALGDTTYDVSTSVSGRDIQVAGLVKNDDERNSIISSLRDVTGRRVVNDNLETVPVASPYVFKAAKGADGTTYSGNTLTQDTLADIAPEALQNLTIASGMPDAQWPNVVKLGVGALNDLNSGSLDISDKTITLSGVAGSLESQADIQNTFSNLPDGYEGSVDLSVQPTKPYIFSGKIDSTGETYQGYIPSDTARADYADLIGDHTAGLTPKAGMPDANWPSFVRTGIKGLKSVNAGEMQISDRNLVLSGAVDLPRDLDTLNAILAEAPEGYTVDMNVGALDDGTPAELMLEWSQATGGAISGKSAKDLTTAELANVLNMPKLNSNVETGKVDGKAEILTRFAGLGQHIHKLESLTANVTANSTILEGVAAPRQDLEALQTALSADLGSDAIIALSPSPREPKEGDKRINEDSSKPEIFRNGFWVPFFEEGAVRVDDSGKRFEYTNGRWLLAPIFDAQQKARVESCKNDVANLMNSVKITFETGSANLTKQSKILLNSISVVLSRCLSSDDLNVEIGGHTDDQGSEDFNLNLSEERAQSVNTALQSAGLSDRNISAKGYGESWPIADNTTEEGRAQNRRTTFTWFNVNAQ